MERGRTVGLHGGSRCVTQNVCARVRGLRLRRWDEMVQRVCTEESATDAQPQTDWLRLAGHREWWNAHEAAFV